MPINLLVFTAPFKDSSVALTFKKKFLSKYQSEFYKLFASWILALRLLASAVRQLLQLSSSLFILLFISTYDKLSLLLGILSASNYQLIARTIHKKRATKYCYR